MKAKYRDLLRRQSGARTGVGKAPGRIEGKLFADALKS
jgi:hypothetical protein